METIKLDKSDWDELLAGRSVTLGKKSIVIKPFTIRQLADLKTMFIGVFDALKKEGIDGSNYEKPENLGKMFQYIASNCPILIETACGLDREDVPNLPIGAGLLLVSEIINANLDSQEGLVTALSYLGKLMAR